jgi:hypothetical protein
MMSNDDLFAVAGREPMKKDNSESEDTLRPEYDLKSLRVRRLGPERKVFGRIIVSMKVVYESDS